MVFQTWSPACGLVVPIPVNFLHDGAGSWGKTVNADLHQLSAVRLVDDHGSVAATASVS